MKQHKNIYHIVKANLCVGCGICEDVCAKHCIQIKLIKGQNIPSLSEKECNQCGLCLQVCPGKGFQITQQTQKLFGNELQIHKDNHLGYTLANYAGYSTDHEIRYHGASGGLVTGLLSYLLRKKIIDGAVVVGFKKENPFSPSTYIARTEEEIIQSRSSKYCAISYEGIASEILQKEGKYVVVGLPCHIQAFRNYERISKKLKERVIGHFALYCSATKNQDSLHYMMKRYGVDEHSVASFTYRDEGCMGSMIAKDENGKVLLKKSYLSYYIPLHGFFNLSRCSLCVDHYGELADVSLGDLQIDKYKEDQIGISSMIIRTNKWHEIIKKAVRDSAIKIESIDDELLKSSQMYAYKHKKGPGIRAAFTIRKKLGLSTPDYDIELKGYYNYKFVLRELMNYACRFIGRHPSLWFIIQLLDRK